jgi:hypothetical protein
MKKGVLIFWLILLALVFAGIGMSVYSSIQPSKYDSFAQCLKQKGAVMYGAFWCPHCQKTKAEFGNAEKYLPYVECSTADGKGQTQICKDKGITHYPTWMFLDGETYSGEHSLAEIASSSGCVLPQ